MGLDGFPEVLPESNGFDVDADDGGVGPSWIWPGLPRDRRQGERPRAAGRAVAQGSEHQRSEAQKLLKRLG